MKIVFVALLAASLCSSEPRVRAVTGRVTDKAGAVLPGSVVECENTVTLVIQSYIVHEDGRYYFKELSPDVDFTLIAHYRKVWSKRATLSKFNTAKEATINLVVPVE